MDDITTHEMRCIIKLQLKTIFICFSSILSYEMIIFECELCIYSINYQLLSSSSDMLCIDVFP